MERLAFVFFFCCARGVESQWPSMAFFFALLLVAAKAAVCNGSYDISTPADLSAISSCTSITGNLVFPFSGLTSVSLPVLTSVGGYLWLYGNSALTSASFPVLASVGGYLSLNSNYVLTSVSFPALTSVGASGLSLYYNSALTSVSFPVLASVGGYLRLYDNDALTSVSLPVLTSVGGYLQLDSNNALTSASFPVLGSVGGYLQLDSNNTLTSVSFPVLASVGGYLRLYDNDALTSVSFPVLASVGGDLRLDNNDALTSVSFPALASVGGYLWLYGNSALTSASFPALASVGGFLKLENNSPLISPSIPVLASVGGSFQLSDTALTSVSFPVLASVGRIEFQGNTALISASFPILTSISGSMTFGTISSPNPLVQSIGFPALEFVSGSIDITDDISFFDFSALKNATSITIQSSSLLQVELPALSSVSSIAVTSQAMQVFSAPLLKNASSIALLGKTSAQPLVIDLPSLATIGTLQLSSLSNVAHLDFSSLSSVWSLLSLVQVETDAIDFPTLAAVGRLDFVGSPQTARVSFGALTQVGSSSLTATTNLKYIFAPWLPFCVNQVFNPASITCSMCLKEQFYSNGNCSFCALASFPSSLTSCALCPPGTYGAAPPLQLCEACPAGLFQDQAGALSCKACPANQYCALGASTALAVDSLAPTSSQKIAKFLVKSSQAAVRSVQVGFLILFILLVPIVLVSGILMAAKFGVVNQLLCRMQHFRYISPPSAQHREKTPTGGLISMLTFFGILLHFIAVFVAFENNSEAVSSSTRAEEKPYGVPFPVELAVAVVFHGYSGACHSTEISVSSTDIFCGSDIPAAPSFVIAPDATNPRLCTIQTQCADVSFNFAPVIHVNASQKSGLFAQALSWQVHAKSNQKSALNSVDGAMYAGLGEVISGLEKPFSVYLGAYRRDIVDHSAISKTRDDSQIILSVRRQVGGSLTDQFTFNPLNSLGFALEVFIQQQEIRQTDEIVSTTSLFQTITSILAVSGSLVTLMTGVLYLTDQAVGKIPSLRHLVCHNKDFEMASSLLSSEVKPI